MSTQEKFSERLKSVRNAVGATQEQFAALLGFTRSYVSQLEAGIKEPGTRFVAALEGVEDRAADWLGLKEGSLIEKSEHTNHPLPLRSSAPFVDDGIVTIGEIPVISWCHAGEATSYDELPKSWQETIPSNCRDRHAFGLVVEGDSMQPNYQSGDILIVMPGTVPRNGCLVVAKYKTDGVVFRRYHSGSEGVVRLTAYNPIYPPHDGTTSDFHWIYPVHSTLKREWK